MSENYQYAECKHCGKSVMEGEIYNCRKMLLTEIADCHATMLRQAKNMNKLDDEVNRLREVLRRIAELHESSELWQDIAREALADRP